MAISAAQSNSNSFSWMFFNSFNRNFVPNRIKNYLPVWPNSEFSSLDSLERRLSKAPENANRITKVFCLIAGIVGWGALTAQIGLSYTSIVDLERSPFLSSGLNYALIGFPLSSMLGAKSSFGEFSASVKAKDKESIDYQISNIAINAFSVIGGVFFVLSKFAAEAAVSFGTAILALPFLSISYLIDVGKKSYQTQKVRSFKKEFKQIVKNDNDLNDTKKLKQALNFLLKQLQVTDTEKRAIEFEINLNEELRKNPKLKEERLQNKIDDQILAKYIKLERRIGNNAAESLRENIKSALNDLNRFFPKKDLAKELVKTISCGISTKVRNNVIMILIKLASLIGLIVATILSGGGLAPIFALL